MAEEAVTTDNGIDQGAMYDDIAPAESTAPSTEEPGNIDEAVNQEQPPKEPAKVAPPQKTIEQNYLNEKGELDTEAFFKDFSTFIPSQVQGKQPDSGPVMPVPNQQVQPPAESPYHKFHKEITDYKTSISENLSFPVREMRKAIQAGYTPEQAIAYAEQRVNEMQSKHFGEYEAERRAAFEEQQAKQYQETIEVARLESVSRANHVSAAREFGIAPDKLEQILYHKDYGLKDIGMLFDMAYPGERKKGGEGLQQKINNWYVKFTAEPANAKYLAECAMLRLNRAMFPKMAEKLKGLGAQAQTAKVRASATNTPGRENHVQKKPAAPDAFDRYMSGDDERLK